MTEDEMDRDVADAQRHLSVTTITVDRCRQESVTETTLWFFDPDKRQIVAATRLPGPPISNWHDGWECKRMHRGMPVSSRCHKTLLEVIGDIMRYEPQAARPRS